MMDMQEMDRDVERAIDQALAQGPGAVPRANGQDMPLDRLEEGIRHALELRAGFKAHLRQCAALIIEIERAL